MQAAEKNTLRGIHGPVAGLMTTKQEYALALEIALGAGLQNIVVDREEDAKAAIGFLKQRDGGRATFLPLTAIRGEELRDNVAGEYGFVGVASRLVTYDPQYDHIFRNLLGRTVVVEDLDSGIAMARKFRNGFRIVTLDGQVINRGGSMTGGSVSRSAGVLSRANELERLTARQDGMRAQLCTAAQQAEDSQRELQKAEYELQVAKEQQHKAEAERFDADAFTRDNRAVYFTKRANRCPGPGEPIPGHWDIVENLDYEVELAVVLGKAARDVKAADAADYIFGYTVLNDVSARDLQTGHKQWYFGKSLDGFTPMGPVLVTADEIAYPPALEITSRVNGELRQKSNTALLITSIGQILEELTGGMTLLPGTIIATGTPAGVGMGFDPPRFLQSGDTVECAIEGIGTLCSTVI